MARRLRGTLRAWFRVRLSTLLALGALALFDLYCVAWGRWVRWSGDFRRHGRGGQLLIDAIAVRDFQVTISPKVDEHCARAARARRIRAVDGESRQVVVDHGDQLFRLHGVLGTPNTWPANAMITSFPLHRTARL